jgi:hypothetical protein
MDEELAGWIERVFSQFRNIALTLGWEDPTTAFAFNRPPRMPAIRSGPYCGPQTEGVDLPTSLNDLPEQVRKFAPKKVRNVGSFHPARTALRAAINELEAAKARRNELLQDQARELDLALRADLSLAEIAVQESTQKVASAAIELLTAAAFTQANALEDGGIMIGSRRSRTVKCGMLKVFIGLNCRRKSSS